MARRRIDGSRAIVTGASSGIGREIARELALAGARQVVIARREERLRELAAEIRAQGGQVEMLAGDITVAPVRQKAVDLAASALGGLDILVNNAGVGAVGLFEDADPGRLRSMMELNFFALAEMTRAAVPLLKQGNRPIVVNIGSVLGHRGVPYRSEYCATKFAVHGFSESIRAEFSTIGIDVLVVSPGETATEFTGSVLQHTGEPVWPKRPVASARAVARETLKAIRRGRHEIMPYRWGKVLCWLNRLSPRFVDCLMTRYV